MQLFGSGRGGVKKVVKQQGIAGILADVINAQRMDTKQIAAEAGINLGIKKMTEDRAAEMLAESIQGELTTFAEVFDGLQSMRDDILREELGDEGFDAYVQARNAQLPYIGSEAPEDGQEDVNETAVPEDADEDAETEPDDEADTPANEEEDDE
jgi:NTP pyrophosphatase (non-canonical NTP hydrolase)